VTEEWMDGRAGKQTDRDQWFGVPCFHHTQATLWGGGTRFIQIFTV